MYENRLKMSSKSFDYESTHSIVLRECALILTSRSNESSFSKRLRLFRSFLQSQDAQRGCSTTVRMKIIPARYVVLDTMTTGLKEIEVGTREIPVKERIQGNGRDHDTLYLFLSENIKTRRILKDRVRFGFLIRSFLL